MQFLISTKLTGFIPTRKLLAIPLYHLGKRSVSLNGTLYRSCFLCERTFCKSINVLLREQLFQYRVSLVLHEFFETIQSIKGTDSPLARNEQFNSLPVITGTEEHWTILIAAVVTQ